MYATRSDLFAHFELGARSLVSALLSGEDLDLSELSKTLGSTIEYMLCDLFRQDEATAPYWVDGVEIGAVDLLPDSSVRVKGLAWCAHARDQWQVPAEILFGFTEGPPFAVSSSTLRIGDAAFASLADHRERKIRRAHEQGTWLHEFVLQCPSAPAALDASAIEARLLRWMDANPSRPVVGRAFQTLDREQAAQYIRSRCAEGDPVTLEETWLDRGPALIVGAGTRETE